MSSSSPEAAPAPAVAHLELKATLLLAAMLIVICGAAVYVLFARGAFEPTQRLVLVADDSEGVIAGMDLTFSGFPIGRVQRIELGDDGNARILIDVSAKDAHWLRESSVFTVVRGLVGSTNIRAYSGILTDPPLAEGAVRTVLRGDATADIPSLVSAARDLVQNLNGLTGNDSPLSTSLANMRTLTGRLNGPGGALGVLLGDEAQGKKLLQALDRTNALLARVDAMAARADAQVFGSEGLVQETQATVLQLKAMLVDARASLKKVDGVLEEAQAVGANARAVTADLPALRDEVESNLRKVEQLVNEVNRRWPFARDSEIKLP